MTPQGQAKPNNLSGKYGGMCMQLSYRLFSIILLLAFLTGAVFAQEPTKRSKSQNVTPYAASNPVTGSGNAGQITKWTGIEGTNTYTVGDSNIFEDKFGKIGIGTRTPTSLLTVRGMIETTLGGYKFPDGTVQTTAGISFVTHDASLAGLGTAASPLSIASGGVQTVHLANNAVTAPKIANGTVVRSFNGLFDNVLLVAGNNITLTPSGNTIVIASPDSLTSVAHNSTLSGNGTTASPLSVANGGIGTTQLADGAVGTSKLANSSVTLDKIAIGQVVTKLNNLTESVTLAAGANISITPSGNTLTISGAESAGPAVYRAVETHIFTLDSPGDDVIALQLPAGNYFLFFRMKYYNNDNDTQALTCTMSTGDQDTFSVLEGQNGHFILQDVATFAAPTTVKVHCQGFQILTGDRTLLTAIRVGSIQ
jgi:hypothetical protein